MERQCGIPKGSGTSLFLQNKALKDITSDFYRGFTSSDGIYYLQTLLDRDDRFAPNTANLEEIVDNVTDKGIETILSSAGYGRLTAVFKSRLREGDEIEVIAPHGIIGSVMARVLASDNEISKDLDVQVIEI